MARKPGNLLLPILLPILLLPVAIRAGDEIQKAQFLSMQMKYVEALKLAEGVLKSPEATPEDVRGAYDIIAQCQASLGKDKAAIDAFQRLLVLQPGYSLSPAVSPKIQAPFKKAAAAAEKLGQLKLRHETPRVGETLAGIEIAIALESNPLELVQGVRLVYFAPGGTPQRVARPVKGTAPIVFKMSSTLDLPMMDYYFEALNADQACLLRLGSQEEPFKLEAKSEVVAAAPDTLVRKPTTEPVPEDGAAGAPAEPGEEIDDSSSWYASWWFWTVVGVVVVGGAAAGLAVGLSGGEEGGLRYDLVIR